MPSRSGARTPTPSGPSVSDAYLSPGTSPRATRSAFNGNASSTRARSQGAESRRISFAEGPRATTRYTVKIPTKNDALSSGFPYDGQKLVKYSVTAKEWNHFSQEVMVACDAHHYNAITWPLARSKVIKRVRSDLKYGNGPDPGPVSKIFRHWNRLFRRQGFQTWLELPSEEGAEELGRSTAGMSKDDQRQAMKEAKRFRIVVSPVEGKGGSIYSKSSLRGSVLSEVNIMQRANTMLSNMTKSPHEVAKEVDGNDLSGVTGAKKETTQVEVKEEAKAEDKTDSEGKAKVEPKEEANE